MRAYDFFSKGHPRTQEVSLKGGAFEQLFGPQRGEFEQPNFKRFNSRGGGGGVPGGGGGVLKFQIDWRIIFMYMIIEISLNFGKAKY